MTKPTNRFAFLLAPLGQLFGQATSYRFALRQWLVLTILLCVLAGVLAGQRGLGRADATLYDYALQLTQRHASDDIVIIAIDEQSLSTIGRWPWARQTHAQLLEQLVAAQPRAVGFDVLFTEPESATGPSAAEVRMRRAMEQLRVVLPVTQDSRIGLTDQSLLPVASLRPFSYLGHIHLPLDEDGICRSVFLEEGPNPRLTAPMADASSVSGYPQFTLAMLQASRVKVAPASERAPFDLGSNSNAPWLRDREVKIPYVGPPGSFSRVSYDTVLKGNIPASFFKDKYVLIGTTAPGIDSYPTPVSGQSASMPGIEIHANILQGLLQDRMIVQAGVLAHISFAVLVTLLACVALFFLRPRWALVVIGTLTIAIMLCCALLLYWQRVWLAPLAVFIPVLSAYPLWSWRRLESAMLFIAQEFKELNAEPDMLGTAIKQSDQPETQRPHAPLSDVLERSMDALDSAAARVRDLRRFLSDAIEQLPNAALISTSDGYVLIANKRARTVFEAKGRVTQDAMLAYLLADLTPENVLPDFSWWHMVKPELARSYPTGVQATDQDGSDWLVQSSPCHGAQGQTLAWLVSMTNVSHMRAAQRRTQDTIRLLTQDIRGPLLTALGRLQVELAQRELAHQEQDATKPVVHDTGDLELQTQLRNAVDVTDAFTRLARAETGRLRLRPIHPNSLMQQAVEYMQPIAQKAQVKLVFVPLTQLPPILNVQPELDNARINVDADLMGRAIRELITNAINHSPANSQIFCSVLARATLPDATVVLEVKDHGSGIASQFHDQVFAPFARFDEAKTTSRSTGLGLVFVRQLVRRLGGVVEFDSVAGEGSSFRIVMECDSEAAQAIDNPQHIRNHVDQEVLDALLAPINDSAFARSVAVSKADDSQMQPATKQPPAQTP